MARLDVATLGTPEVRHAGLPVEFATRKALALLIYLAIEGGTHTREKLTALFWPESEEARARGALRSTLNFLRNSLRAADDEQHLMLARDRLGFSPRQGDTVDCLALLDAFRVARAGPDAPSAETLAHLRAAIGLCRGDFLDGFSLPDAPDFDAWAADQREAWRRRADTVFDRFTRALLDAGDPTEAAEAAAGWVRLDPLNEAAYRRLMRACFAAGDRAGALRAYQACRAVLDAELSAGPAPETEQLATRIQTEPVEDEPRPARSRIPLLDADAPLVGRSGEHAKLAGVFHAMRRRTVQIVSIEGEPGIGKTRLAADFMRWSAAQGAVLLPGRAFESAGQHPYQAIVEVLRRALLEARRTERGPLAAVWLAELSRLLPELREQHPDLPALRDRDPAEDRVRLYEAAARLLLAVANASPVVLWIDDAQWAGEATRDLLQYVVRRLAATEASMLVLLCCRSDDIATDESLNAWLVMLGREAPRMRTVLAPLSEEETHRLVHFLPITCADNAASASTAADALDALARRIYTASVGHPFYVTELVRSLVDRGLLQPDPDGRPELHVAETAQLERAFADGATPEGVRGLVRSRLAKLGTEALAVLRAMAVLGGQRRFEELRLVAELSEEATVAAVDDLVARRLLRVAGSAYLCAHDTIRAVTYEEVGDTRRGLVHRRALNALGALGAAPAELARHALGAGDTERAFELLVAAGDTALRVYAVREAAALYHQARGFAEAGDTTARLHLDERLGRAFELDNRLAEARGVYEEYLRSACAAGDAVAQCAALNRLATLAAHDEVDRDRMRALLEKAQAVATKSGDVAGLVETAWNSARLSSFNSDLGAAFGHAHRGLELARGAGLTEPAARLLNWLAVIETIGGLYNQGETHAREAAARYRELGDRAMEADSLSHLAGSLVRLGRLQEAIDTAVQGLNLAREIENDWGQAASGMHLALALIDQGNLVRALETADEALVHARIAAYQPLILLTLGHLGHALRNLGRDAEAVAAHLDAWNIALQLQYPVFTEAIAGELCADYAVAGNWGEAAHYAREALSVRTYDTLFAGLTRWHETEALLRAGESEAAVEDVRRFGERIGSNSRYQVAYLRAEAAIASARGDGESARARREAALELAARLGLAFEKADIEHELGVIPR